MKIFVCLFAVVFIIAAVAVVVVVVVDPLFLRFTVGLRLNSKLLLITSGCRKKLVLTGFSFAGKILQRSATARI